MARTVIDLDDDLLGQVQRILGTKTKVETVNAALREIAARDARRAYADWLATDPLPDARNPEIMRQAWR